MSHWTRWMFLQPPRTYVLSVNLLPKSSKSLVLKRENLIRIFFPDSCALSQTEPYFLRALWCLNCLKETFFFFLLKEYFKSFFLRNRKSGFGKRERNSNTPRLGGGGGWFVFSGQDLRGFLRLASTGLGHPSTASRGPANLKGSVTVWGGGEGVVPEAFPKPFRTGWMFTFPPQSHILLLSLLRYLAIQIAKTLSDL